MRITSDGLPADIDRDLSATTVTFGARSGPEDPALAAAAAALGQHLAAAATADPAGTRDLFRAAFGARADGAAGTALLSDIARGDVPLPADIRFVGADVLGPRAAGAYAAEGGGLVLLSRDLAGDPARLARVLAEEVGHHFDRLLGAGDACGDEGAIFARLLAGERIRATEMAALRAEDDRGVLLLGERFVELEHYELGSEMNPIRLDAVVVPPVDYFRSPPQTGTSRLGIGGSGSVSTPSPIYSGHPPGTSFRDSLSSPMSGHLDGLRSNQRAVTDSLAEQLEAAQERLDTNLERQLERREQLLEDAHERFKSNATSSSSLEREVVEAAEQRAAEIAEAADLAGSIRDGDLTGRALAKGMNRAMRLDAPAAVAAFEGDGAALGEAVANRFLSTKTRALRAIADGALPPEDARAALAEIVGRSDVLADTNGLSPDPDRRAREREYREALAEAIVAAYRPGAGPRVAAGFAERVEGVLATREGRLMFRRAAELPPDGRDAFLREVARSPLMTADTVRESVREPSFLERLTDAFSWRGLGELALSFTPAGILLDVRDFYKAARDGDATAIAAASVGFLPGPFGELGAAAVGIIGRIARRTDSADHTADVARYFRETEGVVVTGRRAIDIGRNYEKAVIDRLYADFKPQPSQFEFFVDGRKVTGRADHVILVDDKPVPIEMKYTDWDDSIRNPYVEAGQKPWSAGSQAEMLEQAERYESAFGGAIYHTNSVEFAEHYDRLFKQAGLENMRFVITPAKR